MCKNMLWYNARHLITFWEELNMKFGFQLKISFRHNGISSNIGPLVISGKAWGWHLGPISNRFMSSQSKSGENRHCTDKLWSNIITIQYMPRITNSRNALRICDDYHIWSSESPVQHNQFSQISLRIFLWNRYQAVSIGLMWVSI